MYCTVTDLINSPAIGEQELIQRTDRNRTGAIDTTVLNAAMARADADINRYLRVKNPGFTVPPVSDDLKYVAVDLTRFYLYDGTIPEDIQKAYDRALKTLADYADGKVILDVLFSDAVQPMQSAGDTAYIAGNGYFDMDGY